MLMYFGQNETRSLAALMELAEMLMPSVTMSKPMAPKAEAARPEWDPDELQSPTITMGFHTTSPYAVSEAAAVKMPSSPTMAASSVDQQVLIQEWLPDSLKMQGMTTAWTFCAFGVLAYLEKSAMFNPRVA